MTTPDPVDEILSDLKQLEAPSAVKNRAEAAFRNHADEAKRPSAALWRTWGHRIEPVMIGAIVLVFVVWAVVHAFGL